MQIDEEPATPRQQLVILVGADEPSRSACRVALSGAGFEVITASDAATALLVAAITPPDVLLVDLDQPTLSSLIELHDLRADYRLANSRIIGMTGQASQAANREPATRFDHILFMPADQQRLLEVVGGTLVTA